MKESKFIEEQAVLAPEDNLPQVAEILKAIPFGSALCADYGSAAAVTLRICSIA